MEMGEAMSNVCMCVDSVRMTPEVCKLESERKEEVFVGSTIID